MLASVRSETIESVISSSGEIEGQLAGSGASHRVAVEHSANDLEVFPGGSFPTRVPERCGWMVGDHEWIPTVQMGPATEATDRLSRPQQRLRGKRAEGHDHCRVDQVDLLKKER